MNSDISGQFRARLFSEQAKQMTCLSWMSHFCFVGTHAVVRPPIVEYLILSPVDTLPAFLPQR